MSCRSVVDWVGLDWIWITVDWIGLDWIGLRKMDPCPTLTDGTLILTETEIKYVILLIVI
jgi:hypothetical protein